MILQSAYEPNKTLIQLGILKVKDLVFKRGQKGYNRKVYDLIQEIKTHLPKNPGQTTRTSWQREQPLVP